LSEDKQIPEADNVASSGLGNVIKIDDERIAHSGGIRPVIPI
jgi:hypothetical protein